MEGLSKEMTFEQRPEANRSQSFLLPYREVASLSIRHTGLGIRQAGPLEDWILVP